MCYHFILQEEKNIVYADECFTFLSQVVQLCVLSENVLTTYMYSTCFVREIVHILINQPYLNFMTD